MTQGSMERHPATSAVHEKEPGSQNFRPVSRPTVSPAIVEGMDNGRNKDANKILERDKAMPIAIVGIGCRFPQDASSPENLWDMLLRKKSALTNIPAERFNVNGFHHPDSDRTGTMCNRGGYFLKEDIAAFDAPFFSISPAEAKCMDPMQRILLEVVYEALENGGIPASAIAGSDTGCYVGCFTYDYDGILKRDIELSPRYTAVGVGNAMLANRISFSFDLKGPSLTIDSACSSSLIGVHLACQSLRIGESKMAIVGGANAILNPDMNISMTNMHFLSPDSKCYAFDERANGYARAEGVAAIILKPLRDALRDGDTIRAVIRGTASNQDGKTPSITVPSKSAQISVIQAAYDQAGCDPSLTGYFEAHGTGTQAGDPVEASAIGATLGKYRTDDENGKLYVGSIKTNIGHMEGASGLAGLIKAVLSVERGIILPNLWFEKGNPAIDFDRLHIRVPTEPTLWPSTGIRRASINSFGYGGSNAHVIIDDASNYLELRGLKGNHRTTRLPIISNEILPMHPSTNLCGEKMTGRDRDNSCSEISHERAPRPRIFYLAAHEREGVIANAKAHASHLSIRAENYDELFLDELAYTLSERRSRLQWGSIFVASTTAELSRKLNDNSLSPVRQLSEVPKIGFVFSGQGAQWWRMGRELLVYPIFAQFLNQAQIYLEEIGSPWSLLGEKDIHLFTRSLLMERCAEELGRDEASSRINEATISQPLCTAMQIALVELYSSWNIHPSKVVGHSSGEIAAAYTIGALSLKSAMQIAYYRGICSSKLQQMGFKGGMLAVGISERDAQRYILAFGSSSGKAVVACVNSPSSVTLSGDDSTIAEMHKALDEGGLFTRRLRVNTAYHSHHMLYVSDEYGEMLSGLKVMPKGNRKNIQMVSSVSGYSIKHEELGPEYWVKNMASCVRFSEALECLCNLPSAPNQGGNFVKATEIDILVEIGPHAVLAGPVKQTLGKASDSSLGGVLYESSLLRDKDARITTLEVAGSLFLRGYPVSMRAVQFPNPREIYSSVLVDLPSYRWNHKKKYWSESRLSAGHRFRHSPRDDVLGAPVPDWNPNEPRWRNFIRLSEQPWIRSHVVQGTVVYPAAGYICMALQAAKQLHSLYVTPRPNFRQSVFGYTIRNLYISRALVVPETEDGIEVILSMRPSSVSSLGSSDTWNEFCIFSYSVETSWTEHCRGLIAVINERHLNQINSATEVNYLMSYCTDRLRTARLACTSKGDRVNLYQDLAAFGLEYGPAFRNIVDFSAGGNKAVGVVQVPDTSVTMPYEFEFEHFLHPTTMDSFMHMMFPALCQGDTKSINDPYIPTFIEDIRFSADILTKAGHKFTVAAEARFHGRREAFADIVVIDEESSASLIHIENMKCTTLTSSGGSTISATAESRIRKHCVAVSWEPDIDMLTDRQLRVLLEESPRTNPDWNSERILELELLAYYFCNKALKEIKDEDISNMHESHRIFFRFLEEQCRLVPSSSQAQKCPDFEDSNINFKMIQLQNKFSNSSNAAGRILVRLGQSLNSILRGETDPLSLMMKDDLLPDYFADGMGLSSAYPQMERYLALLSHKYPNLEYLEIGDGFSTATTPALRSLSCYEKHRYPRFKSYTFTDPRSKSEFFEAACKKYSLWKDMLRFRQLDIDEDLDKQSIENSRYDVVLLSKLPKRKIEHTISNIRRLLKPGGRLIFLEITRLPLSFSIITRVLLNWSDRPGIRESETSLEGVRWSDLLKKSNILKSLGIKFVDQSSPVGQMTRISISQVGETDNGIISMTPENGADNKDTSLMRLEHSHPQMPKAISCPRRVTIVHSNNLSGLSEELAFATKSVLETRGYCAELCAFSSLQDNDIRGKACLSLTELDDSLLADISNSDFKILHRLTQDSAGIMWITRGGTAGVCMKPELSLFQGLARCLRAEQEGFICTTVDLDPKAKPPAKEAVELLVKVFEHSFNARKVCDINDHEFSEIGGMLHIKRVIEDDSRNWQIATRAKLAPTIPETQYLVQPQRPLKVEIGSLGSLDSLLFVDSTDIELPLAENEVEIEIHAVGLNFRDLLVCLGEIPDDYLGNECAGMVTKVGAAVQHLKVGDRVNALCQGSFSTHVRNPGGVTYRIPDDMNFVTAASIPIVYVSAYYGIVNLSNLRRGESILIHSAAGGVGQAAIQIAQMIGADIFATVGTQEKREHLIATYGIKDDQIFSSRDLHFSSAVMKLTCGRGIDVILNSLTGEALAETWRCVAPFGRFIELGKKDISKNRKLDMIQFKKNVMFASVDVALMEREAPMLARELLAEVMGLVRAGSIKEITPVRTFPFSQMENALRLMQSGKHIGKIVLECAAMDQVQVKPRLGKMISFPNDASYLLAGGLGGLGRSISQWMVANGARNLIFVSRSGASSAEARKLVRDLISNRVRVIVLCCDISDEEQLSTALASAMKTMPPIHGVIQGAMVLKDQIFSNMDAETFKNTTRPKVQGSWSLHKATLCQPLDFFVLLSSAFGFLGNAGQSNYVAGCTYQVALAKHRISLGLPATSIDIGRIAGVGVVAENIGTIIEKNLVRLGMLDTSEEELHVMIEMAMLESGHLITGAGTTRNAASGGDLPYWSRDPVFSHLENLRPHLATSTYSTENDGAGSESLYILLSMATSISEVASFVLKGLLFKLSKVLMMPLEEIDEGRPSSAYGIDSLIAVEIRNWIFRETKADIPLLEILQARTLAALAQKIAEKCGMIHDGVAIQKAIDGS